MEYLPVNHFHLNEWRTGPSKEPSFLLKFFVSIKIAAHFLVIPVPVFKAGLPGKVPSPRRGGGNVVFRV
jgi:hypothetical protein